MGICQSDEKDKKTAQDLIEILNKKYHKPEKKDFLRLGSVVAYDNGIEISIFINDDEISIFFGIENKKLINKISEKVRDYFEDAEIVIFKDGTEELTFFDIRAEDKLVSLGKYVDLYVKKLELETLPINNLQLTEIPGFIP